ncbi:hypothetical protein Ahy_B01g052408 [Arachis hypogaea]|uniref:Uncharacterized protein n=1 Tax=Arachis hypogaea TaxID=3818 RepID=A0A445API8_ARAHY|nr:hypothetical protein Ahy_B01g052408 [Arachis hypogaea]
MAKRQLQGQSLRLMVTPLTRAYYKEAPKNDNIWNNMCEVFNFATKPYKSKPILTLLEEVRRFDMISIARNKLKLTSHVGHLPPLPQRLAKERPKNYVHALLTMGSHKTCELHINLVRREEMWTKFEYSHCLPPARPKPYGVPKNFVRKNNAHEALIGGSQE